MTIEQIGEEHRVAVKRDECGDKIIPGKNGHLYMDEDHVCVCFTDEGRKKPFTKLKKTKALQKIGDNLIRIQQNADCEFIARIKPEGIRDALFRVLSVRRFMVTKGVPKIPSAAFIAAREARRERMRNSKKSSDDSTHNHGVVRGGSAGA